MGEFEALRADEAAFWAKYTDDGRQRTSYSKVLTSLKTAHKEYVASEDVPTARNALRFFHGDLSARPHEPRPGRFEFRKGAKFHVVTSDKEIARRWRTLLEDDEAVRLEWEATSGRGHTVVECVDDDAGRAASSDEEDSTVGASRP